MSATKVALFAALFTVIWLAHITASQHYILRTLICTMRCLLAGILANTLSMALFGPTYDTIQSLNHFWWNTDNLPE